MTTSTVQPETVHGHSEDPFACPVFRLLPDQLQEESRSRPFLWDYLHTLAVDEIGVPEYAETLENVHRDLARPNLVYPTGAGVYAHICPDMEDSRNFYVSIEPAQVPTLPELLHTVDLRLMDYVETLKAAEDPSMRAELLLKCIDDICTLVDQPGGPAADAPSIRSLFKRDNGLRFHTKEFSALMRRLTGGGDKIEVSALELMGLKYVVLRDKVGLGVLEPLIGDPYIEDVSCSGLGNLFLEHRIFGGLKASIGFASDRELDRFVIRLSEKIGRPVTYREPIVDAVLPDGSRVNIVFGGDVSKRGSNFTIRKFSATPMSLLDLISSGSLSHEMAAYMSFVLREEMNVFISGETASGKTTLLNALTTFINPNSKIVSIEDTPELQVPHMNWIREVSRGSTKEGTASSVSMMDLLKAALRQRPNEIIIGEIRGEEGAVAFQAMQTGPRLHGDVPRCHGREADSTADRQPNQHPEGVYRQPQRRRHHQRRAAAQRQDGQADREHQRDSRLRSELGCVLLYGNLQVEPCHGHPRVPRIPNQLPAGRDHRSQAWHASGQQVQHLRRASAACRRPEEDRGKERR